MGQGRKASTLLWLGAAVGLTKGPPNLKCDSSKFARHVPAFPPAHMKRERVSRAATLSEVLADMRLIPDPAKAAATEKLRYTLAQCRVKKRSSPVQADNIACPTNQAKSKCALMEPSGPALHHPLGPVLSRWSRYGVEVNCGEQWDVDSIRTAVERGPHSSALTPDAMALIREDVEYQVASKFSEIVLWDDIKDDIPPSLKISPVAVVPQAGRRGRIILDLSFPVHKKCKRTVRRACMKVLRKCVNETTERLAPEEAVKRIGKLLPALFKYLAMAAPDAPVLFSKIDLADGFWRMTVPPAERYNFAYVMPDPPGSPIRLVLPSALQMGWCESPGYFCTATDVASDVMEDVMEGDAPLSVVIPGEEFMMPEEPIVFAKKSSRCNKVYVDDFCLAVQPDSAEYLVRMSRAALTAIYSVFPGPEKSGHVGGRDPVSAKKLKQGDARWAKMKTVLGFEFDGEARTVRLPPIKLSTYLREIDELLANPSTTLKAFRRVIGKLRHAAMILPAELGFFSPLNRATAGDPHRIGLGKKSEVRKNLEDLRALLVDASHRPTHVNELVRRTPDFIGYTDACATGAGGVWFSGNLDIEPLVWRISFPPSIASQVVSDSNPNGSLTNSDLEQAAVLLQFSVLEQHVDMRHRSSLIFSDNSPTVAWSERMADRSRAPTAGRLLRGFGMMQREAHAAPVLVAPVAGADNDMADFASRFTSDPTNFVSLFNKKFPIQAGSWKLVNPRPVTCSAVFSSLRGKRLEMHEWTMPHVLPIGGAGRNIVSSLMSQPSCQSYAESSKSNCCSSLLQGCGRESTEEESRFVLDLLTSRFGL